MVNNRVNIAASFVIFSSIMFHRSQCYSAGAPTSRCDSMTPNHGSAAQVGASPYTVKVEKPYYMQGENVRLSIESSGDDIRGFLIQARQVGVNSSTGTFGTLPTNGKYLTCSGNSKGAATHNTGLSVKTLNFEWEPPSGLYGNISFLATVVKDKATFWVKLASPELYKRDMPSKSIQASKTIEPTKSMTAPASMAYSTPVVPSTPTANNTCNPTCEGNHLSNNFALLLFVVSTLLVFLQNAI